MVVYRLSKRTKKNWNVILTIIMVVSLVFPSAALKPVIAATNATDLFISEYVEGSSNNKALEIYNGTGQAVELSGYSLELYSNGGTTVQNKLTLPSYTLQNGATYVVVHNQASTALKAYENLSNGNITAFNGDDVVLLKNGTTVIDSIGKLGERPTAGFWGTSSVKTADQTLVRKSHISIGDRNTADSFDPALEWDAFPTDTFSKLGSHAMDGGTPPIELKVANITASLAPQAVESGTAISLSTVTDNARIYYTLDGTEPTDDSTEYIEPIIITKDTTIKAVAIKGGYTNSDIATFVYTILAEVLPPVTVPAGTKSYHLNDFQTKKLIVTNAAADITMDAASIVSEELIVKSAYAKLQGAGLQHTDLVLSPSTAGATIDLSGVAVKEVNINHANVSQVRGAENVQSWQASAGVDTSAIKFADVNGTVFKSPFINEAPILSVPFLNRNVLMNTTITVDLSTHFIDPEGASLTYTSTVGEMDGSVLTILTPTAGSFPVTVSANDGVNTTSASFTLTVANPHAGTGDYYANAVGKTGFELKAALHNIIKGHVQLSYDQAREALKDTDEDPSNSNNVILLYTGRSQAKSTFGSSGDSWNREHVWAKSHGDFGTTKGPGTDIHHLRPTDASVNSSRGHLDFDNGGKQHPECKECYYDSDSWEPPNRVKGDIARMLMYMAVRYEGNGEIDLELADKVNTYPTPFHGKLSVLLEWNRLDPVDAFEMNRNNVIQTYQKNRNPFIDHPEWADMIWGN
jgi:endonuclease I